MIDNLKIARKLARMIGKCKECETPLSCNVPREFYPSLELLCDFNPFTVKGRQEVWAFIRHKDFYYDFMREQGALSGCKAYEIADMCFSDIFIYRLLDFLNKLHETDQKKVGWIE